MEVAHILEADSFICAYQRFVSLRGKPIEIYSDNGTNFKGAWRELREALKRLDQTKIYNRLRSNDVQWSFNPPEASHQGGIWEGMIGSVRRVLGALLKEQLVDDETLSTLPCEAERILNDRPLTSLSDHPDDPELLTPNKLLLLRSNSCFPPDVFKGQSVRQTKSFGEKGVVGTGKTLVAVEFMRELKRRDKLQRDEILCL